MPKNEDLNDDALATLEKKADSLIAGKKKILSSESVESKKFDDLQALLSEEQKVLRELREKIGTEFEGQTLVLCESSKSKVFLTSLAKIVLEKERKPALVLTTMNYHSALDLLNEAKVDSSKVWLLDTVSKNLMPVKEKGGLFFIDSLRDLTQLEIKIMQMIKTEGLCFVFDSMSVLALYHEDPVIYKFMYSLTKILHKYGVTAFYLLTDKRLLSHSNQFFDNIIEFGKE